MGYRRTRTSRHGGRAGGKFLSIMMALMLAFSTCGLAGNISTASAYGEDGASSTPAQKVKRYDVATIKAKLASPANVPQSAVDAAGLSANMAAGTKTFQDSAGASVSLTLNADKTAKIDYTEQTQTAVPGKWSFDIAKMKTLLTGLGVDITTAESVAGLAKFENDALSAGSQVQFTVIEGDFQHSIAVKVEDAEKKSFSLSRLELVTDATNEVNAPSVGAMDAGYQTGSGHASIATQGEESTPLSASGEGSDVPEIYPGIYTEPTTTTTPTQKTIDIPALEFEPTVLAAPTVAELNANVRNDTDEPQYAYLTVTQKNAAGADGGKFKSLSIDVATITAENADVLEFDAGASKVAVTPGSAALPTAAVSADKGTFSVSGNKLVFTFDQGYLANTMPYCGETYTFTAAIKVKTADADALRKHVIGFDPRAPQNETGMDACIIYQNFSAATSYQIDEDGFAPGTAASNQALGTINVSTPRLEITKSVSVGGTAGTSASANAGETLTYTLTVGNASNAATALNVVVTDTHDNYANGAIVNKNSVVVKQNNMDLSPDVTKPTVDANGNLTVLIPSITSATTTTITYTMTFGSKAEQFKALVGKSVKNSATVTARNDVLFGNGVLDDRYKSKEVIVNILEPSVTANMGEGTASEITTNTTSTQTANFTLSGEAGVKLLNPKVTLTPGSDAASQGAIISDVEYSLDGTTFGKEGVDGLTIDLAKGGHASFDKTGSPFLFVRYKVSAPSNAASNGAAKMNVKLTADNLSDAGAVLAEKDSTVNIYVPEGSASVAISEKAPSTKTPSASPKAVDASGNPVNPSTITVLAGATQTASGAKLLNPKLTVTDTASLDGTTSKKFSNLAVIASVGGESKQLETSVCSTEAEWKSKLDSFTGASGAAAVFASSDATVVQVAYDGHLAYQDALMVSYEDVVASGFAPNGSIETVSAVLGCYDDYKASDQRKGNLPASPTVTGSDSFTVQTPAMTVSELVTSPLDESGQPTVINVGDTIGYLTTFQQTSELAKGQDFEVSIVVNDVKIESESGASKTYTAEQVGLSIADGVTLRSGDRDVTGEYTVANSGTSLNIKAATPGVEMSKTPVEVAFKVSTANTSAQYSDQLRGADISVTSYAKVSNLQDPVSATAVPVKVASAHLKVSKAASKDKVMLKDDVVYTLTIENDFDDAASKARKVVVEDSFDEYTANFGFAINKSTLKASLGDEQLSGTSGMSVEWDGTKGFKLTCNKDIAKSTPLVITYSAVTDGITGGSYSQDLSNVVVVNAENSAPAVAASTIRFEGDKIVDEAPQTAGTIPNNPSGSITDGGSAADSADNGANAAAATDNSAPASPIAATADSGTSNTAANGTAVPSNTPLGATGDASDLLFALLILAIVAANGFGAAALLRRRGL